MKLGIRSLCLTIIFEYQPEEVFPKDGTPEEREHAFWVTVDPRYFNISKTLQELKLEGCINSTTCLSTTPKVTTVERGTSASIYVDNAAYRSFIYQKFNSSLRLGWRGICRVKQADTFTSLAATNSVSVVVEFIKKLSP
ncbi:hypothetical protein CJ030_MR8G014175 [Morella rubra]|uniref:Uncharacterized protein n=1 Tax=Morella rubra TaxID=262757 RepID=A0A6A1UVB4_9ROSI|nr:hypothetical protein CJ030_MR8G014175 [Morella rubra]